MPPKHIFVLFLVLFVLNLNSCKPSFNTIDLTNNSYKTTGDFSENDLKSWYLKDIIEDSIPGISLDKAYNTILKNKKSSHVIVAVIDQVIDINHRDLKQNIWVNTNEIPNNAIDDDKNGYIDDINGWDFLGNKEGVDNKYMHYDYVRMVKAYDSVFKDKDINDIASKDTLNFIKYTFSKSKLYRKINSVPEDIAYANNVSKWKNNAKETIINYFNLGKDVKFSTKALDSLKALHPKDSVLQENIQILSGFIANGYTDEHIESLKKNAAELLHKQLNVKYNERAFLGDHPDDISDISYGYSTVNNNVDIYAHGTIITGVIIKDTPEIKIMSLSILGHGSSHDKDIALAIRYAVNNGAKVINMSFGKMNSLHKEWVDDAIRDAEKNNVIIIAAAGNNYKNMDSLIDALYPDDRDSNENEFVSNFMKVGGSTRWPNESLKYDYSNYGAINIDIFAPAEEIYTTFPNNSYKFDTGTSLASAITSKVAALIFSYYPNLKASQVKQIIMDSGVEYTFPVKTPTKEDKDNMTPFNELSKSGKIVNAYNALIMADSVSKANKRKLD